MAGSRNRSKLQIQGLDPEVKAESDAVLNEQFAALEGLQDALSSEMVDDNGVYEAPPQSEVKLPTAASLSHSMTGAAANVPKGGRDVLGDLCKKVGSSIDQDLKSALTHKEENVTGNAAFRHKDSVIAVPSATRDIANTLYVGRDPRTNRQYYQRGKADKILQALFGPTAKRVAAGAARCGFHQKPLLWVSQILYHQVNTEVDSDTEEFTLKHPELVADLPKGYNELVDDGGESLFMRALRSFCESSTVRNLSRAAKYEDVSVVAVARSLMWKYLDQIKAPING